MAQFLFMFIYYFYMKNAEFRLNVLKEYKLNSLSIKEICEKYSIGKRTVYRWLNSFNQSGFDGLVPKSTKPKNIKSTPIGLKKLF